MMTYAITGYFLIFYYQPQSKFLTMCFIRLKAPQDFQKNAFKTVSHIDGDRFQFQLLFSELKILLRRNFETIF
jgi:quinol-cytochrome oxidoreductase complex cytochrome b subunit